jgi:hypothetical protein
VALAALALGDEAHEFSLVSIAIKTDTGVKDVVARDLSLDGPVGQQ